MEKFIVQVCKGIVRNQRKNTSRIGWWVPINSIPQNVAGRFGADKATARNGLGFDLHNRQWRDMRNAKIETWVYANAVVVTMDDGTASIALLDF